jgi:hypothetical protein
MNKASTLKESIEATSQGDFLKVLTFMGVVRHSNYQTSTLD